MGWDARRPRSCSPLGLVGAASLVLLLGCDDQAGVVGSAGADAGAGAGPDGSVPDDAALDSLYALEGTGRYLEADQEDPAWWPATCTGACRSGAPTFPAANPDRKIDYVLFSADHVGSVAGGVVAADGSQSDHLLTRGAARSR